MTADITVAGIMTADIVVAVRIKEIEAMGVVTECELTQIKRNRNWY